MSDEQALYDAMADKLVQIHREEVRKLRATVDALTAQLATARAERAAGASSYCTCGATPGTPHLRGCQADPAPVASSDAPKSAPVPATPPIGAGARETAEEWFRRAKQHYDINPYPPNVDGFHQALLASLTMSIAADRSLTVEATKEACASVADDVWDENTNVDVRATARVIAGRIRDLDTATLGPPPGTCPSCNERAEKPDLVFEWDAGDEVGCVNCGATIVPVALPGGRWKFELVSVPDDAEADPVAPLVPVAPTGTAPAVKRSKANREADHALHGTGCASCGEEMPRNECPEGKRACGHHCNHSWSHDSCCWCGEEFGEVSDGST